MRKIFGVRRRIGTEKEKEEYIWRKYLVHRIEEEWRGKGRKIFEEEKMFGPRYRKKKERNKKKTNLEKVNICLMGKEITRRRKVNGDVDQPTTK